MKLPENVKLHPVERCDPRYSVSNEYIVSMRPLWVARVDGVLITYCDEREVAEEMCRIHSHVRKQK